MKSYRLIHLPMGCTVATVRRADNWQAKGRGVMGWRSLPVGEGLWLPGVASVHTVFVRFPLDLLFLDADFQTIRLAPETPAWRLLVSAPGARHTLELGHGTLAKLSPQARLGDAWELKQVVGAM